MKEKIRKIIKKITTRFVKNNKWKLYIYFHNQLIDKKWVDEFFMPMSEVYVVKLNKKKHLIGTNKKTQMVFRFYKYKFTNDEKKEVHIEVVEFEGVDE